MPLSSKVQLGFRFPKKLWDFVGRDFFDIFSWMRCRGLCCCSHLMGTTLSTSELLHSELVVTVTLSGDSGESETWLVDSAKFSTEVGGTVLVTAFTAEAGLASLILEMAFLSSGLEQQRRLELIKSGTEL